METEFLQADWLMEVPEDLDVCIAQRDFEGAVDLIEKGNSGFNINFLVRLPGRVSAIGNYLPQGKMFLP